MIHLDFYIIQFVCVTGRIKALIPYVSLSHALKGAASESQDANGLKGIIFELQNYVEMGTAKSAL